MSKGGRKPQSPALRALKTAGANLTPKDSTVDKEEFPEPILNLDDSAREYYTRLVDHLNEAKVLYPVDSLIMSVLAKNIAILVETGDTIHGYSDVVQEFENGATNITGIFTAFERATKNIITLSAKLGLSPADREKMMSFSAIRQESSEYEQLRERLSS